jgi:hypothetical protein
MAPPRDEGTVPDGRLIVARALVNVQPQKTFSRAQRIAHDLLMGRNAVVHQVGQNRSLHLYELREIDAEIREVLWDFYRSGAEVHLALTRLNVHPLFVGAEALNDCVSATIADDIFPDIKLHRSDAVVFRPDNGSSIEPRVRGSVEPAPGAAGTVTRVDPGSEYGLTLAHVAFGGTVGTWIVPEGSLQPNPKITAES